MTTITHALAPIILVRLFEGRVSRVDKWDYILIGLAGGLADIINPHIYLRDRLTSWSHGLPFWLLFSIFLIGLALLMTKCTKLKLLSVAVAVYCSLAYLLHLFCDGISGGINLLHPIEYYYWGMTLIPFPLWIPLDVLNLIIVCLLFRSKKESW